ncbi:hypothetical protein LOD99_7656 [Oopsacas minuta]|uniref:THAP-type domain-containing protein n=1 Tax=Oopsacas minuta TaxID=111878 RepID=A0AAV7JQJ4_9METZ|nr:hypothetical protein LOD99_7656 [Oopsacas minuta]
MPEHPPELKQAWTLAIDREDIERLLTVRVCIKHFLEADIEYTHRVPFGDGTFTEVPRYRPKLKDGAVPCLFPGRPSFYISPTQTESNCLLPKADEYSELSPEEKLKEKFILSTIQGLITDQLVLISKFLANTDTHLYY